MPPATTDDEDLRQIASEHSDVMRIERLTHHVQRIREGMDELRTLHKESTVKLETSMQRMAEAMTRLVLIEERQVNVTNAVERTVASLQQLDERVRVLEVSAPIQQQTASWVAKAVWAAAAAAVVFVAAKAGLV